jgi:hypothetical protein
MAKVEFYKIILRDKKESNVIEEDISKIITQKLDSSSPREKYCVKSSCSAILSEYVDNIDSLTFDFSKFTDKIINSTIISQPLNDINTFEELNAKIIDSILYTDEEKEKIVNITSLYIDNELINNLINFDMDDFKIYKILKDNNQLIEEKELKSFYLKTLTRMEKEKIFFNICSINNVSILLFQKASHGFEVNHLSEYLNRHLFISESFSISFEKIYDSPFLDILENAELTDFKFSYSVKEKSILDQNNFSKPFTAIVKGIGNNNITILAKAEKNNPLKNEKLMEFFELASEAGLLNGCSVKKKGDRSFVNSTDKGLQLNFVQGIKIETLHEANDFFKEAFINKLNTLDLKTR